MDLIAGDTQGNVTVFLNTGTKEKPVLADGIRLEANGKPIAAKSNKLADVYSKIHVADWNDDGLPDLLVGHNDTIILYRNAGTRSAPRFSEPARVQIPQGRFPSRPSPYVVDWDGDGKKDLLVGSEESKVFFYRNVGTNQEPRLARGTTLALKGPSKRDAGYRWRLDVTDWNNDGKKDLLVGNFYSAGEKDYGGNVWLFLGE